jgi:GTPase
LFIDSATISVKAGNGGNGMVSFRTEKYVPNGGPDGGDGGKGGDIILYADNSIRTLQDFRYKRRYAAGDGERGGRRRCSGEAGKSLEIGLPVGTVVKDAESGRLIVDLSSEGERFVVARGGHGGRGNIHFANSVRQAPNFARAGEPGEEFNLQIEIKLLADVGLIGYPNVGKSTLLSVISSAKPKIADYHFTTIEPNLGVVDFFGDQFVVADIPGLIEGASEGHGLGHEFLKHIERTRMFIHVVDVSGSEGRDPVRDFHTIMNELEGYQEGLSGRPQVLAANKSDLATEEQIASLRAEAEKASIPFFLICAPINSGVPELMQEVGRLVSTLPPTILYDPNVKNRVYSLEQEDLFTIEVIDNVYHVEGKWVVNLVDSTNFDDVESVQYFQRLLRKKGVIDALEAQGIQDDDLVVMHTLEFEYMR